MRAKDREITCKKCNRFRKEEARGLCSGCYRAEKFTMVTCLECGQYKRHSGLGLCQACHSKKRRMENPNYFKAFDKKKWEAKDNETRQTVNRKQYLKNPDKYYHYGHSRRARIKGLPYDLTYEQWLNILKDNNNACYYCKATDVKLQREHKTPLSKGGGYTYSNIVPACQSCNSLKGEKTESEFIEFKLASLNSL